MDPNETPRVFSERYELNHLIARGGMAEVYRAHDRLLDRPVALKVLFPELSIDRSFVERFRREAQAAANLSHHNIVPVFDWGEDTGTYFSFHFTSGADFDEAKAGRPLAFPATFNMNYFRPHTFGLEAEPEVAAFVQRFRLTVSDPQRSGMGDGEYSADGFLRGWNAGNAFATEAVLAMDDFKTPFMMPASVIEATWRWNLDRESRQDRLHDDLQPAFVPRIMFLHANGKLCTCAVWGDGIPILLPRVDIVIVPRSEFAPRGVADDVVLFEWKELEALFGNFRQVRSRFLEYELFYEYPPVEIEKAIRGQNPPETKPQLIGFDKVLDQEMVERKSER